MGQITHPTLGSTENMDAPKCAVKNCENNALVAYGSKFICGECLMKLIKAETDEKNKRVEELEI